MKIRTCILFLTLLSLGFSCSKEKKIKRTLLNRQGVWNVTNVHTLVYLVDNDSLINEINHTDFGALIFHGKGTFDRQYSPDSKPVEVGTWLNTDDEIILSYNDSYYNGPNVCKILEQSKTKMTWRETTQMPDMVYVKHVTTYELKRGK